MKQYSMNKCTCGGQPRLLKGSRQTTETIWRNEEWKDYNADGSYVIRQRDYQVVIPKAAVTHYAKCPKCKTETAKYGTKTKAVNAWNTGE